MGREAARPVLTGESKIVLGERFFHEVITNPVPLDLHILHAVKRSPLGLDLYLWLTYRTFNLKRPLRFAPTRSPSSDSVSGARGSRRPGQAFQRHEHMESRMRRESHVRFGGRAGETHRSKGEKALRSDPTRR